MVTAYWILEYVKVLLAYLFITFVWPSVVFQKFLKGKPLTVWFFFCVTVQIVLNNTVVLLLGLVHLLNAWVLRILFYGTFFWALFHNSQKKLSPGVTFKRLVTGTYGIKLFTRNIWDDVKAKFQSGTEVFRRAVRKHRWEYILLGIVLIYGMIYFTYGSFQDYFYGFGDMYPHSEWTYGLIQGQIFSAGVYPEAMHCYVYSLHTLFGIRLYSCMLFLAGVHIITYLVAAYTLFKEIFRWRFSAIFALVMFLTIDLMCIDEVYSMSRLQWTIPQEFGLFTVFICGAFLIRYLRSNHQVMRKGKLSRWYWDENLFVFMMALSASLAIHFYPTIMAFFLCICVVPVFWKRVFNKKRFWPLVISVVCGVFIAVVPMVGALASGIQFQGSIGWAMHVIEGTAAESTTNMNKTNEEGAETGSNTENSGAQSSQQNPATGDANGVSGTVAGGSVAGSGVSGTAAGGSAAENSTTGNDTIEGTVGANAAAQGSGNDAGEQSVAVTEPAQEEGLFDKLGGIFDRIGEKLSRLYKISYEGLFTPQRAKWILGVNILTAVLWLGSRIVIFLLNKDLRREPKEVGYFDASMVLTLAAMMFMVLYAPSTIGMPELVAGSRVCSTGQMLILAMMMIPVDMIFAGLAAWLSDTAIKVVSTCFVFCIYLGTMLTGTFHGFLYYEFSRFNGAVLATHSITKELPEGSYTIVSPTDELYQMIQYGWHEELVNFVNMSQTEEYRLPSEYVFIYVEKNPLEYGQSHFFTGPKWLAWEKYTEYYHSYVSQCPDITTSDIAEVGPREGTTKFATNSKTYSNLTKRTQVQAIAAEWCQEFERLYPGELKTYYEDDRFVCYYFKQNIQSLYQLGILAPEGGQ